MISGLLPLDKPLGWTSHDVVARLRRVTGQRQIGHTGTLDPLATGVLVLVLGSATRLSAYVMNSPKVYCAGVVLGVTTVTDDAEGGMQARTDISGLTLSAIEQAVAQQIGTIEQIPPRYAAIKRGGEKLYALARQGIEVEPEPRRVTIERIEIVCWEPPRLRLRVWCSPGTYIRSLARDIGASLGVGGYLHALRRVRSGSFSIEDAVTLDTLQSPEDVLQAIVAPDRALLDLPAAVYNAADVTRLRNGRAVPLSSSYRGTLRLYDEEGRLVGLGEAEPVVVRPVRIFAEG